jgi:hypothetical protein
VTEPNTQVNAGVRRHSGTLAQPKIGADDCHNLSELTHDRWLGIV